MIDDVNEPSWNFSIKITDHQSINRFERVESTVKARETVANHAGVSRGPPVDPMADCMRALAKCDRQTVANMFSKCRFHFACLRRELEAQTTI